MKAHPITIHIGLAAQAQSILNQLGINHTIDLASAAKENCCVFQVEIPPSDIPTLEQFLKRLMLATCLRKEYAQWQADSLAQLQRENTTLKQQIQSFKNAALCFFERVGKYFQERDEANRKRFEEIVQKRQSQQTSNNPEKPRTQKRKRSV